MFSLVFLATISLVAAIPSGWDNGQIRLKDNTQCGEPQASWVSSKVLEFLGGAFSELSLTLTKVAPVSAPPQDALLGGPLPELDPKPETDIYVAVGEPGEDAFEVNPEDYDPEDILYDEKSVVVLNETVVGSRPESFTYLFRRILVNGLTYGENFKRMFPDYQSAQYLKRNGNEFFYFRSTLYHLMRSQALKLQIDHIVEINTVVTLGKRRDKPPGVTDDAWEKFVTMTLPTTNPATNAFKRCVGNELNSVKNLMWLSGMANQLKGHISTMVDKNSAGVGNARGPNFKKSWAKSSLYTVQLYMEYNKALYDGTTKRLKECIRTHTGDEILADYFYAEVMRMLELKIEFVRFKLATADFKENDMHIPEVEETHMPLHIGYLD